MDLKEKIKAEIESILLSYETEWEDPQEDETVFTLVEALYHNGFEQFASQLQREARAELILELLQHFNDYDVPLTMTAEDVREQLTAYLSQQESGSSKKLRKGQYTTKSKKNCGLFSICANRR